MQNFISYSLKIYIVFCNNILFLIWIYFAHKQVVCFKYSYRICFEEYKPSSIIANFIYLQTAKSCHECFIGKNPKFAVCSDGSIHFFILRKTRDTLKNDAIEFFTVDGLPRFHFFIFVFISMQKCRISKWIAYKTENSAWMDDEKYDEIKFPGCILSYVFLCFMKHCYERKKCQIFHAVRNAVYAALWSVSFISFKGNSRTC